MAFTYEKLEVDTSTINWMSEIYRQYQNDPLNGFDSRIAKAKLKKKLLKILNINLSMEGWFMTIS